MDYCIRSRGILKVVKIAVLATFFCISCDDKGADDGEPAYYYHTVTLDADGGTVDSLSVMARQCRACNWAAVSLPIPTRDGYTFRGWWTGKDGTGGVVNETINFGFLRGPGWDTTLYAHWTLAHYTITFDAHGGEVTPAHDTTGEDWRLASLPTPTRADHTFDGWYMDVVGVKEKVAESKVYKGDVTLYAHWVYTGVHYTITLDATGGTVDPPTEETDVGGKLQDLPTPDREGYAFAGWFTEKSGGAKVTTTTEFGAASTIYAQWVLITDGMYTVTFEPHGGIVTPKSAVTDELGELFIPLPTPKREGYAFNGWLSEDGVVSASTVFKANTTVHATWNIIHYTITFDAAGGTVSPTSGTTGRHWELDILPVPKRDGYTFIGWYTEKTGGTHVLAKSTALIGNISIYAHWAENPPSLVDSRDGKAYKETAIGEQIWMAENLNYASPNSRCLDDDDANCAVYGRLYDWTEALTACPVGWHLPSDAEWTELTDFIGGTSGKAKKLRSQTGWERDNPGTDDYGFSALPGGYGWYGDDGVLAGFRRSGGGLVSLDPGDLYVMLGGPFNGYLCCDRPDGVWWTGTKDDDFEGAVWHRLIAGGGNAGSNPYRGHTINSSVMFSVRCVKD